MDRQNKKSETLIINISQKKHSFLSMNKIKIFKCTIRNRLVVISWK